MKILKTLIVLIAIVAIANSFSFAATTSKQLDVKTTIGDVLDLIYWLEPQGGAPNDGSLNFGDLTIVEGTLASPWWYQVGIVVQSNSSNWVLQQVGTQIVAGLNKTMPQGALKVNGPSTNNEDVAANVSTPVTLITNSNYSTTGNNYIYYSMPKGTIPQGQAEGSYTGTVTLMLTTN